MGSGDGQVGVLGDGRVSVLGVLLELGVPAPDSNVWSLASIALSWAIILVFT